MTAIDGRKLLAAMAIPEIMPPPETGTMITSRPPSTCQTCNQHCRFSCVMARQALSQPWTRRWRQEKQHHPAK
jgi:hypothetical protein